MRKSKLVAAAVIGVLSAGYTAANAQSLVSGVPTGAVSLYTTATDWGGSYEAATVAAYQNGQQTVNASTAAISGGGTASPDVAGQIGWNGWGNGASYPDPTNVPTVHDSPSSPKSLVTFSGAENDAIYGPPNPGADTPGDGDLDGSTVNGLGNYDNSGNDSTTADSQAFTPAGQYVGLTGPAGGLTFVYSTGYVSISSGEIGGNGAMLNAIGVSGTFYINFTLPGGATSIPALLAANPGSTEGYLGIGLRSFTSVGVTDLGGAYFGGTETSANGIFTAAIPYDYTAANGFGPSGFPSIAYGGFNLYYNSNLTGITDFVTVDSLSVVQNPVPEPASLSLIGLAGGMLMRRRRTA
jgi:hypothetical protein